VGQQLFITVPGSVPPPAAAADAVDEEVGATVGAFVGWRSKPASFRACVFSDFC